MLYRSHFDKQSKILAVTDNKYFWKTVPLSDKIMSKEKIALIEVNEIVSNVEDTAQVLGTFFQTM